MVSQVVQAWRLGVADDVGWLFKVSGCLVPKRLTRSARTPGSGPVRSVDLWGFIPGYLEEHVVHVLCTQTCAR